MEQTLEGLRWFVQAYGPAAIPSLIALFLAWKVASERTSGLFEDYHEAIVQNTKVMQQLVTLLDERTRRLDARSIEQDERAHRLDEREDRHDPPRNT